MRQDARYVTAELIFVSPGVGRDVTGGRFDRPLIAVGIVGEGGQTGVVLTPLQLIGGVVGGGGDMEVYSGWQYSQRDRDCREPHNTATHHIIEIQRNSCVKTHATLLLST